MRKYLAIKQMKLKQLSWLWNFCGWFNVVLAGFAGFAHHNYHLSPLPPANILMRPDPVRAVPKYIIDTKTLISLLLLRNMKNHVVNLLHPFFLYIIFHFVLCTYFQSFSKWNECFRNIYKIFFNYQEFGVNADIYSTMYLIFWIKIICGPWNKLSWSAKPEKGKVNEYESRSNRKSTEAV